MLELALRAVREEKPGSDSYDLINRTIDFLIYKNGGKSREEYLPTVQEEVINWMALPSTYNKEVVLNCIKKNIDDLAGVFYETQNNKSREKDWSDARDCIARAIAHSIIKKSKQDI